MQSNLYHTNNINFSEFHTLLVMLECNNYSFTVRSCFDGFAIQFQDGSDVAINSSTYGAKDGLLEGYNGVFIDDYDEVTGYMTARDVINKLGLKWYNDVLTN